MANLKEIEEPFEKSQVGSSAMAYKRNPMRCERVTGLSRLVLSLGNKPADDGRGAVARTTLDDSSNRRVTIAEAFLATDGILEILTNVADGLVVYPKVIECACGGGTAVYGNGKYLMAGVQAGGSRQELHEKIRRHSHAAAAQVKQLGKHNDLIDRLKNDPAFKKGGFQGSDETAKLCRPCAAAGR